MNSVALLGNINHHLVSPIRERYGDDNIIAIVVGICGLAVGGAGVAGYFHVGALSNITQMDAVIMMVVGGGGGFFVLIGGVTGAVENRKKTDRRAYSAYQDDSSNSRGHRAHDIDEGRQTEFITRTGVGLIRNAQMFGKRQWEAYFGAVGTEPPLPRNIDTILNRPCPFSRDPRIKVRQTHMLVLIPSTVNGAALTLNSLEKLIQHPRNNGHKTQYEIYSKNMQDRHGNKPVGRSHWVLMTRDVIPGSKDKYYSQQQTLVSHAGYDIPTALEAAVCISMEHVFSGKKLFEKAMMRCAETAPSDSAIVNFVTSDLSDGLYIYNFDILRDDRLGVAALLRI